MRIARRVGTLLRCNLPTASHTITRQRRLLSPIASLLTISRTFNSLSKVLFIFPSRYLFAIGLSPVFSFRWNVPPILGCIPKQPDSSKPQCIGRHRPDHRRDCHPLWRRVPGDLCRDSAHRLRPYNLQFEAREGRLDFKFELFPLHSPLLRESLLVSFPPLTDMLKFSG